LDTCQIYSTYLAVAVGTPGPGRFWFRKPVKVWRLCTEAGCLVVVATTAVAGIRLEDIELVDEETAGMAGGAIPELSTTLESN
jgi:hypothetical protein